MFRLQRLIAALFMFALFTDAGTGEGDDGDDDGGNDDVPGKVEMSQTDLDKLIAARVAKATKAAKAGVADELGVSVTEAKAILDAQRAKDEAAKTETERALEAAANAKAEADAEKQAAQADRLAARVERELTARGLEGAALNRVAVLVDYTSLDDDVVEAVDAVAADLPGLFTPPSAGTTGGVSSTPKKRTEQKPAPKSSLEAGREAAAARFKTNTNA